MKTEQSHPRAREFVTDLAVAGRYDFVSREAQSALDVSPDAAKLALNRLAKKGLIASPARGFYVIVPPEYRSLGCLPADQFIPALMQRLGLSYYVGLLSAAQYHGAAHYRPQEFQVFLAKSRRPIHCGKVRVAFMARSRVAEVPVRGLNTPRGTVLVSTPEATAVDLVGYQHRAGGFDQVATVLSELAEQIDPEKVIAASLTAPIPWAQRLGYLLELGGFFEKAAPLKAHVGQHAKQSAALQPAAPRRLSRRDKGWKLYVNADVEIQP
jgi:predicted transcriptional regulator of viral defense system